VVRQRGLTVDDVAPYPPERGEKFRWLPFPVGSPDRTPPEPAKVKRKSGGECDPLATLGARPRGGPAAPDDRVHDWRDAW